MRPTLAEVATREIISVAQWQQFVELLAFEGVRVSAALKCEGIVPLVFRRYLDAEPRLRAQFARCKQYAYRRRFPRLAIQEILDELSRTNDSLKDICLCRGFSTADYQDLVCRYLLSDEWRIAYLNARRAKVQRLSTRLLDTPDDALLALGKSGVHKAQHAIWQLRPRHERLAELRAGRAERAARDPVGAARHEADWRAKNKRVRKNVAAVAAMHEENTEETSE